MHSPQMMRCMPHLSRSCRLHTLLQFRLIDRRDGDGFAAAASACLVGISENEASAELVGFEIHFGSEEEHEGFRINDDLNALVLYDFVVRTDRIGKFERI